MRNLAIAAVLATAHPLHAADSAGEFAIKGAGLQTCEALATAWDQQSADLGLYIGWIDGYLTGLNQHLPNTFDAAPWQTASTLLGLTRQLCRGKSAGTRVMDAFDLLIRDFLPVRLQESSTASAIQRGDTAMALYTETIARLQRRLAEEGFDPGEPNGVFGTQTAGALEAFQKARDLEVTGMPDQATLFSLFVRTAE